MDRSTAPGGFHAWEATKGLFYPDDRLQLYDAQRTQTHLGLLPNILDSDLMVGYLQRSQSTFDFYWLQCRGPIILHRFSFRFLSQA